MGDALVDSVLISLADVMKANSLQRHRVRPVIDALVNRMRQFGYSDEVIHSVLVPKY